MAIHVVLAAGTYVFGKAAAVGFPDARSLTLARALGAGLLLLPLFGWALPWPRYSAREWLEVIGLGALLVAGNQFLFLIGMRHTSASHPALFFAMTPLLVLLLTCLLERRLPSLSRALGVLIGAGGVLLLLRPWSTDPTFHEVRRGDLAILCSVLAWTVYTVFAGKLCRRHDPRTFTGISLLAGALLYLPVGLPAFRGVRFAALDTPTWIGIAYLCAITSVVMMLVWNRLLKHLSPVEVAICANMQPVSTALLSALLAGTPFMKGPVDLSPLFFLCMAMIVAGILLVQGVIPAALASRRLGVNSGPAG